MTAYNHPTNRSNFNSPGPGIASTHGRVISVDTGTEAFNAGVRWVEDGAAEGLRRAGATEAAALAGGSAARDAFASAIALAPALKVAQYGSAGAAPLVSFAHHVREGAILAFKSLQAVRGTRIAADHALAGAKAAGPASSSSLPHHEVTAIAVACAAAARAALAFEAK